MSPRSPTWFIGVDLAWSDRHSSGVAILSGGSGRPLRFVGAEIFKTVDEIAGQILALDGPTWTAIDAPLVVKNNAGARQADRRVSQHYGRFEASAHSTNLARLGGEVRGGQLAQRLASSHARIADHVRLPPRTPGSWVFETYPHAAMVELFHLNRTIKYKKGRLDSKREGVARLTDLLRARLPKLDPPLPLSPSLAMMLAAPTTAMVGAALKAYEDRVDALLCAYLAAHLWRWGGIRNWALGPPGAGTVILPAIRSDIDRSPRL